MINASAFAELLRRMRTRFLRARTDPVQSGGDKHSLRNFSLGPLLMLELETRVKYKF
jgi:hypothetical protein